MHIGEAPRNVAAACINSDGKPEATFMQDVEAPLGAWVQQTERR